MCVYTYIYIYICICIHIFTHVQTGSAQSTKRAPAFRTLPRACYRFMCGLYCYHFNNLRFNNSLNFNRFPIPISNVFVCFK